MSTEPRWTWAQFTAKIRRSMPVESERLNTQDYLNDQIVAAVVDLQRDISKLQQHHETVYGPADLTTEGKASKGTLPYGAKLQDGFFVKTGTPCSRQPLTPFSGGWGNRFDLICGAAYVNKYQFLITLDPRTSDFYVFPKVEQSRELDLFWDGVKEEFADADLVPFRAKEADVASWFVKARCAMEIHKDPQQSALYEREYIKAKRKLYLDYKEEAEMAELSSTTQADVNCASTCDVCETDTDVALTTEFVAFGDSGLDVERTMYPYPYGFTDMPTAVADFARSLQPDFILHLGNVAYPSGEYASVTDQFIKPYRNYIQSEKLYLALGETDVLSDNSSPAWTILDYLAALNATKRYYNFTSGPCEIFVLDSYSTNMAEQEAWLDAALDASAATWKIVALNHAPYTSEELVTPGESVWRLSCFNKAHLILSGNARCYERIQIGMAIYLTCGIGGITPRAFVEPRISGSQFAYYDKNGLLHITADEDTLKCRMLTYEGDEIESVILSKSEDGTVIPGSE